MGRVDLVLGGGAVRGLAHLGLLKAFERHHIHIDSIAGTSMGGVIGGLYAAGVMPDELEQYIQRMPKYSMIDFGLGKRGLLGGDSIYAALGRLLNRNGTNAVRIEELPIRFKTVSVDLMEGRQIVFEEGDLLTALRATTAFPGIFSPLMHEGMMLVDGGVLNNLPVDILDGESFVIAVDVTREHEKKPPRNLLEVVYRSYSLMTAERKHHTLQLADFVIRPDVGHITAFDFTKWKDCIDAGESAAEGVMEELKQRIALQNGSRA
ncbi:MAG: patatin-like phospholipase family protein [Paenibacillus sp.]|uniref:patatin-like phospholipase family protein n=1 Tax=Paenibacillus sp. TaxID=58172 RepID=UPI0028FFD051|nr:patatin-like phospholipase family protein [Paenibacillus sp.]MDU2242812.1 patatin-like phospholipase family protein [Paenibacillus sp.]